MKKVQVTGVGFAGFSLSWDYVEKNRDVVRRVLTNLEDKRVLMGERHLEDYEHCRLSADKIRQLLNLEIPNVAEGGKVEESFKKMRKSARDFIDAAGVMSANFFADDEHFNACLTAFKITVGREVDWLRRAFNIDLEPDFLHSLPEQDLSFIPGFGENDGNDA